MRALLRPASSTATPRGTARSAATRRGRPGQAAALLALLLGAAAAGPLQGAVVVAADGTFLGTCDGPLNPLSISNAYGNYGSSYFAHSMYNRYGDYGNTFGLFSPQNPQGQPAYLFRGSTRLLDFLTASGYRATPDILAQMKAANARRITVAKVQGAITPAALRAVCKAP